jgi:uncharacterized protein DUF4159
MSDFARVIRLELRRDLAEASLRASRGSGRGGGFRGGAVLGLLLVAMLAAATGTPARTTRGPGTPPGIAEAQRRGFGRFSPQLRMASTADSDGAFHFCRIWFRSGRGDGSGWGVDYPQADANLSIRLSDLTRVRVSFDASREPNHLVVRLTDDELFQCPFIMMTEVGALYMDDDEVERLREYLLKGGFLWADDFWGSYAWAVWESQIRRVLPAGQYPFVNLPLDHPLFRTQFVVKKVPQIPSINFWMGSGGGTSEAGYDSQTPEVRAILDDKGRIMVMATHNTDLGDSWEREGDDPNYFYAFAVDGYALGINVVLYSMIR